MAHKVAQGHVRGMAVERLALVVEAFFPQVLLLFRPYVQLLLCGFGGTDQACLPGPLTVILDQARR